MVLTGLSKVSHTFAKGRARLLYMAEKTNTCDARSPFGPNAKLESALIRGFLSLPAGRHR